MYDYISGLERPDDGEAKAMIQGGLKLFCNFDEPGRRLERPRTLLVDSEQLESGDVLHKDFRDMAAAEIERYRRETIARTGDRRQAADMTDRDLLREIMNTVGKEESIRCVVSVSMLTEGWDTNNVTHIPGVRALGTQSLCEPVVGRALRRQSYDLAANGLFEVEYADVLGIPFDFTAKPVVVTPQPPRPVTMVQAVEPDRDRPEIRCPRVSGYRVELPTDADAAEFTAAACVEWTPAPVGPTKTRNAGNIGQGIELNLGHTEGLRQSSRAYHSPKHLLYNQFGEADAKPKLYLLGKLEPIVMKWPDICLHGQGGTFSAQLVYPPPAAMACERILFVVEIKGFRGADAKVKKNTRKSYWMPGVDRLPGYGRGDLPNSRRSSSWRKSTVTLWTPGQRTRALRRALRNLAEAGGSEPQLLPIPRRRSGACHS